MVGAYGATTSPDGGHVETVRQVYYTPTEVVVVYTTIYYDASGNIVDVKVDEVRIPRHQELK